jgi:hypothetical protein
VLNGSVPQLVQSYDTKYKYIFLDLATHEMINGRFLTISSQFFRYLHKYISQDRVSDGHFEMLNRSEPQLVQKVMMQNANVAATNRQEDM